VRNLGMSGPGTVGFRSAGRAPASPPPPRRKFVLVWPCLRTGRAGKREERKFGKTVGAGSAIVIRLKRGCCSPCGFAAQAVAAVSEAGWTTAGWTWLAGKLVNTACWLPGAKQVGPGCRRAVRSPSWAKQRFGGCRVGRMIFGPSASEPSRMPSAGGVEDGGRSSSGRRRGRTGEGGGRAEGRFGNQRLGNRCFGGPGWRNRLACAIAAETGPRLQARAEKIPRQRGIAVPGNRGKGGRRRGRRGG